MSHPKQLPLFGTPSLPSKIGESRSGRSAEGPSEHPFSLVAPPDGSVRPAAVGSDLRRLADSLPAEVRLGTSSWSFTGWRGLVYEGGHGASELAQKGLGAYSQHPLFQTVGLDRTFYAPMSSVELRDLADQTPKGFRFMVKAHEAVTLRRFPEHPRYGRNVGQPNPLYLDSEYAQRAVVAPVVSGFGDRLGFLLFQFAPKPLGNAFSFAERLSRFLSRLPSGLPLAVELRTPGAFTSEYVACLEENRASHSLLVHPTMPPIEEQWERTKHLPGPVLVRWMLRRDRSYQVARAEFAPFDRIALDDERSREEIARIIEACAAERRPITVIANNKAEGSSPLSLARLAEALRTV